VKAILRATAILGSSTLLSVLARLIASKGLAVLLGPGGIGFFGLLQNFLQLALLIAALGIGTALVRAGAHALASDEAQRIGTMYRAAWVLAGVLGCIGLLVLISLRMVLGRWLLAGETDTQVFLALGVALIFSLGMLVETSILSAHQRVGALAKSTLANNLLGAATSLLFAYVWGQRGLVVAVLVGAILGFSAASYFRRRELGPLPSLGVPGVWIEARQLLRFGVPYTASMVVGTGVQLALPAVVFQYLGTDGVGYYRAAVEISIGYLGVLLVTMSQDYYPRISAAKDRPVLLAELVNHQHRLMLLLAVPMILGVMALAPWLVRAIYSPQFTPAVVVLEWQLIGDLFKIASWTMSYVILARGSSSTFFLTEFFGGSISLLGSWLGLHWFGLSGIGIAFLITTASYYVVVWLIARWSIAFVLTAENKAILTLALCLTFGVRCLSLFGLDEFRTPVALLCASVFGLFSLYLLRAELGFLRSIRLDR